MIPIMKPLLPKAEQLLPYLKSIDETRWYSNYGALNAMYERKLEQMFGAHCVTCSSGTSGLIASLMAVMPFNYKTRAMVGMPSWTFAATANAIFAAGFRPLICDVETDDVLSISSMGGCQGFVAVAPFGKPLDLEYWDNLGSPVVIDAASGFDSFQKIKIGKSPVVISTHCTKVFGTGEGGLVLSQDKRIIDKIRRILNQGMLPDKSVSELGFNGKLSEYHAAIGLAGLEEWEETRKRWLEVQYWYGDQTDYATSTHSVHLSIAAAPIVEKLASKGIKALVAWYGTCHKQDVFMRCWFDGMGHDGTIRMSMKRTNILAENTIFLPKYMDMTKAEVNYVMQSLRECLCD